MAVVRPKVSFVMATHNRRAVVARTLVRLGECGLRRDEFEIIAVDNASTDGTADAIAADVDHLIRLDCNRGSCAKSFGVERAEADLLVFVDDDSFPRPGSIERMIRHFEADVKLAAAGFTVHLPDGRREGGALPGVFVGCGVGLRKHALSAVGGLDGSFFMQAEEYDLCFRLVGGGWRIAVLPDLHVEHLKTAFARRTDRTAFFDIRNNLRVIARHLPDPLFTVYCEDALQRYRWLAQRDGHSDAHGRGAFAGLWLAAFERCRNRDYRLSAEAIEFFFQGGYARRKMAELRRAGVGRVILADLGKNVYAVYQAARAAGVDVAAIADDRFAAPGRCYRGIPILPVADAADLEADAVVVSNTSAVHAQGALARAGEWCAAPAHCWFSGQVEPVGIGVERTGAGRVPAG